MTRQVAHRFAHIHTMREDLGGALVRKSLGEVVG
jgi:hypothetical protein